MTTNTEALLHGGEVGPDELEEPEASAVFEVVLGEDEEPEEEELDEDEEVAELAIEKEELDEEELDEELGEEGAAGAGAGDVRAGTEGRARATAVEGDEPDEEEDAEETEADLDAILQERMGTVPAEAEDEDEAEETVGAPTLLATTAEEFRPRGADEFVCRSCFLVKDRRQLADPVNLLCVDCANGQ